MSTNTTKINKKMRNPRTKNIGEPEIEAILEIIDTWSDVKLTWELLMAKIAERQGLSYTRQTLSGHARISNAFRDKKLKLAKGTANLKAKGKDSSELTEAELKIAQLELENTRLSKQVEAYLEMFGRWAYNARLKGLTKEFLDKELPPTDRGQTRI